jgi:hypothetical protein
LLSYYILPGNERSYKTQLFYLYLIILYHLRCKLNLKFMFISNTLFFLYITFKKKYE